MHTHKSNQADDAKGNIHGRTDRKNHAAVSAFRKPQASPVKVKAKKVAQTGHASMEV